MRKASTRMLEPGIQAPSPAPDLIPAEHQSRTYIQIGTMNGSTSLRRTTLRPFSPWTRFWNYHIALVVTPIAFADALNKEVSLYRPSLLV